MRLAAWGDLLEQLGDLRQEAHVGHLVGLVQDGDGHLVQWQSPRSIRSLRRPGRGHDDLGAAAQRLGLAPDRHPADRRGHPQSDRLGVGGQRLGDLLGEFAGGNQDQGQRAARLGPPARGTGQHGQSEGDGLAGAGPARPSTSRPARELGSVAAWIGNGEVTPCRASVASSAFGHVQFGERLDRGQRRGDTDRHGELALGGRARRSPGVRTERAAPVGRSPEQELPPDRSRGPGAGARLRRALERLTAGTFRGRHGHEEPAARGAGGSRNAAREMARGVDGRPCGTHCRIGDRANEPSANPTTAKLTRAHLGRGAGRLGDGMAPCDRGPIRRSARKAMPRGPLPCIHVVRAPRCAAECLAENVRADECSRPAGPSGPA